MFRGCEWSYLGRNERAFLTTASLVLSCPLQWLRPRRRGRGGLLVLVLLV
jgi:hypothetical protein